MGSSVAIDAVREMAALVERLVPGADDGTGTLGIIIRQALVDDPAATAGDIAEIVREAIADAREERQLWGVR